MESEMMESHNDKQIGISVEELQNGGDDLGMSTTEERLPDVEDPGMSTEDESHDFGESWEGNDGWDDWLDLPPEDPEITENSKGWGKDDVIQQDEDVENQQHEDDHTQWDLTHTMEDVIQQDCEGGENQYNHNQVLTHTYPEQREILQRELKGQYVCPKEKPLSLNPPRELTSTEELSLRHFLAWQQSNGTEKAYNLHAKVLENATKSEILSLTAVKKLAMNLSGLRPHKIDVCPNSCIAYTGANEGLTHCPYIKDKKMCGEPRYKGKSVPRAQMVYVSCFDIIQAMYANKHSSSLLRHRDQLLKKALYAIHQSIDSMKTYSDFGDSNVQGHLYGSMKLFGDGKDVALALSTDGAQLNSKKQSNVWIALLILLNLPPEIRYQTNNTIVTFIVPGPNNPGDLESFLYPLFVDMAKASEGIWMWDAIDSSAFINHAYICMVLGDMLGSAKISGMAGHTAVHGDRFSTVTAARSSTKKGSKYLYYPVSAPKNDEYNKGRPCPYDLNSLPIRTEDKYWEAIRELSAAPSMKQCNEIVRKIGISRMPLATASPAFIHPCFYPLDPFHLFFENIMPFIWDIWTIESKPNECIHLSKEKAEEFGKQVVIGMKTLPPEFCGLVRNPHLKRQSQYKAYEWMALLYWFVLPVGMALEFDYEVLHNFSCLVEIVEFAMSIKPRSDKEIDGLQQKINKFLLQYEMLYVGNDPEKVSRCRLCIFQLVHVPMHIKWYGSVRLGSQATVERAIGEAGHKIHSKKSPFVNMANIFFQKELMKTLLLYYPSLQDNEPQVKKPVTFGKIKIQKWEKKAGQKFYDHLLAIFQKYEGLGEFDPIIPIDRLGKCNLENGNVLTSALSENHGEQPK